MQEDTTPEEYADGDYGYDLVHEDMSDVHAAPVPKPEPEPEPSGIVPPPDDSGGDYGYDLAHDMRSS